MPPYIDSLRWEISELEKTLDRLEGEHWPEAEHNLRAQLRELETELNALSSLYPTPLGS